MISQELREAAEKLNNEKWFAKYEMLKKYHEEHHHLCIPSNTQDEEINALANWFNRQKHLYKHGDSTILTQERIDLLNQIDINWFNAKFIDLQWWMNYNYCKEFSEKYNTLAIPLHYEPNGIKVGRWIRCQREKYWGKRLPKLEQWQINALEEIGMDWENDAEKWKTYQTSYPEQAIYFYIKQVYPDAQNAYKIGEYEYDIFIPSINTIIEYDGTFHHKDNKKNTDEKRNKYCIDNNIKLYRIREKGLNTNVDNVVCLVRKNNNSDGLNAVINELLEHMGIDIDVDLYRDATSIVDMYMKVPETRWLKSFAVIQKYYNEYGTLVGIPSIIDDVNVKSFLGRQRQAYKMAGKHTPLSTQKINLLKSLDFEFRTGLPFGIVNVDNVDKIKEKLNKENKILITPNGFEDDTTTKTLLNDVNKALLINEKYKGTIGVIKRDILSFDEGIKYAEAYYNEHGNLLVPERYETDEFKLGDWIGWQRKKYYGIQGSPLTIDEIKRLEAIGMVWDVLGYNWNQKFAIAKQYHNEFGTINIGVDVKYKDVQLGRWLTCQREIRAGRRKGKLSSKQISLLDELGFSWESRDKSKTVSKEWMQNFNLLKEYVEIYGYSSLKYNTVYGGKDITRWLNEQKRKIYKSKKENDATKQKKEYLNTFFEKYDKDFLERNNKIKIEGE